MLRFLRIMMFDRWVNHHMPNKRGWTGPFVAVLVFGLLATGGLLWRNAAMKQEALALLDVSWVEKVQYSNWDLPMNDDELGQLAGLIAGLQYQNSTPVGKRLLGNGLVLTGGGKSMEFVISIMGTAAFQAEGNNHSFGGAQALRSFLHNCLERTLAGLNAQKVEWADAVTVYKNPVAAAPEQIRQLKELIGGAKLISVVDTAPTDVGTMMTVSLFGGSESRDFAIYEGNLLQWRDPDRHFYLYSIDPAAYALVEELYRSLMVPA